MRIVTKINTALGALIGVSVLLNLAALEFTVKPSFAELEEQTARANHERVLEALGRVQEHLRGSARDYAFWDDTYEFLRGERPDYVETNINAEALGALNANFFLIADNSGKLIVNEGYDFSGDEPAPAHLIPLDQAGTGESLQKAIAGSEPGAGLFATSDGLAAVGFSPVFRSDSSGASPGTLLIGSMIDIELLMNTTKVDFRIDPPKTGEAGTALTERRDAIEVSAALPGLGGASVGELITTTPRSISKLGQETIWAAIGLIAVAGLMILAALAALLRKIAITRIERMRGHLTQVAATGSLSPMPVDAAGDELSDVAQSFNSMAGQLGELRERIRQQDYREGAADHAAGILHNVRNGISPIGAIAWSMASAEDAAWKDQVRRALTELHGDAVDPDRIRKLQAFVTLSAEKFLAEGAERKRDIDSMRGMIRHLDEVLAADDSVSQIERMREPVEVEPAIRLAAQLVESRPTTRIKVHWPQSIPAVLGSAVNLKQILGNIFINSAEAIEATGRASGRIVVEATETVHAGQSALDITISDDGEGIDPSLLTRIFEKGFSTRRARSGGLGLHWCSNTVNAMGGRLEAKSKGSGHGATLHLVLPLAAPAVADAA
jgi:two-component system, NtrC family, sensor kinase